MPWIIDYSVVLEQMREQRFKCLYYNSGAFGFPADVTSEIVGWTGPADETIRPEARAMIVSVAAPYEVNLSRTLARVWQDRLPGRAWVMPMSHWAFELDHGSRDWMPAALEHVGIDPGLLAGRTNGAAIEFSSDELQPFTDFTMRLLEMLSGSDFMIAFPKRPALCVLHHHKQLWWTTSDAELARFLRTAPQMQV